MITLGGSSLLDLASTSLHPPVYQIPRLYAPIFDSREGPLEIHAKKKKKKIPRGGRLPGEKDRRPRCCISEEGIGCARLSFAARFTTRSANMKSRFARRRALFRSAPRACLLLVSSVLSSLVLCGRCTDIRHYSDIPYTKPKSLRLRTTARTEICGFGATRW